MQYSRRRTGRGGLDHALLGMALGRVVLGAGSLVAPVSMARAFGVRDSAELSYLTRVFGARAVALGVGYLTGQPAERARLQRLCLGVDVADTVEGVRLLRREGTSRRAFAAAVAITAPYAAIGAARAVADLRAARS